MTNYEIISVSLSIIAIGISLLAILISKNKSKEANNIASNALKEAQKANATSWGNLEFVINERITTTQIQVTERLDMLVPFLAKKNATALSAEENTLLEHYQKALESAIEGNLNAYEEACAKYFDNKVDKNRFKKSYFSSIRQLVEQGEYKKYFDPTTTKYKAILKIYKDWNDLEQ